MKLLRKSESRTAIVQVPMKLLLRIRTHQRELVAVRDEKQESTAFARRAGPALHRILTLRPS